MTWFKTTIARNKTKSIVTEKSRAIDSLIKLHTLLAPFILKNFRVFYTLRINIENSHTIWGLLSPRTEIQSLLSWNMTMVLCRVEVNSNSLCWPYCVVGPVLAPREDNHTLNKILDSLPAAPGFFSPELDWPCSACKNWSHSSKWYGCSLFLFNSLT